jgi:hypothetical protein
MAELVLHAGIQKTGSTFLQRNLKANRAHLNAAGFGYIHYTEIKRSPWWRYIDGRSVNRRAALASLAETLETETSRISGTEQTVLYSCEAMFGKLLRFNRNKEGRGGLYHDAVERMARMLDVVTSLPGPGFDRIQLFFFYRKQSRFLGSWYGQMINQGLNPGSFEDFLAQVDLADLSWVRLLERLEALHNHVAGLVIRAEPYEAWIGPEFLPRFLAAVMGRAAPDVSGWTIKPVANPSLSPRGMELARSIRRLCSRKEWGLLRMAMQKHFAATTEADRNWLPPSLLADCRARFEAENRTLPGATRGEDYC